MLIESTEQALSSKICHKEKFSWKQQDDDTIANIIKVCIIYIALHESWWISATSSALEHGLWEEIIESLYKCYVALHGIAPFMNYSKSLLEIHNPSRPIYIFILKGLDVVNWYSIGSKRCVDILNLFIECRHWTCYCKHDSCCIIG